MAACGYCIYWRHKPEEEKQIGECHRRQPIVTGGMMSNVETVWPRTTAGEVCGEFEANKDF